MTKRLIEGESCIRNQLLKNLKTSSLIKMLVLRDYLKKYHDHIVLSIPSYSFTKGLHWIKGENGAGKSTLFKSIGGIIPFDGKIMLNDLDVKQHAVRYRSVVNYSEAEPVYPGFLTPKDLVRFVGTTKGASVSQQDYYVERFGITTYFENACQTFSSGMLKKVSLVLAFLGNPQLIILDEPFITLDAQARSILFDLVLELANRDISFLMSSHQFPEEYSGYIQTTSLIANKTLTLESDSKHL